MDKIVIPAHEIPSFQIHKAFERAVEKKWLVRTWGGLGDVVCAEPTIRYIKSHMPHIDLTVQTRYPELFMGKNLKIFDEETAIDADDYYTVSTINQQNSLAWEFLFHSMIHPVDYVSLNILRSQLPVSERHIVLETPPVLNSELDALCQEIEVKPNSFILVHPGRHWPSKTFPVSFWERLVKALSRHFKVVLIGKRIDKNVGYVDFEAPNDVIDLRGNSDFELFDLIAFLKVTKFLFSNDSSPIHIAAAGDAHIGFISSCKHPDFLKHWRDGKWGYRMYDFARDNLYYHLDKSPVQRDTILMDELPDGLMEKLLPDPEYVADAMARLKTVEKPIKRELDEPRTRAH